ncbi:CsgG/HfaB family protein [Aequorivita marina]|uniref:CsgG/HfaB family protein n=1 Tax=Aequorivita marina TaxID=3073654 RepID=UPI0028765ECD|nr:CsgG/HfaB family protein [Aequorivita sp. S2608]MDS1299312.1 CsgG/HfaB family protein [Aequorivita sp. S2608]
MKNMLIRLCIVSVSFFLGGCGAYFNQPLGPQDARLGEITNQTTTLYSLPKPEEPIIAGVYNFKDQTGQYKNIENGSTFSTAITQGATTILIKALEDSKWFRPIERENLSNLLNERNIIRSTREEYRKVDDKSPTRLTPLLFAGILLEGGVVSYDSNILTGGAGARYFGLGASTQYRQDRITVYLRAVSTNTGEVLKTVYVSKTILSQAVDVGLFKYVNFQRLLEVETGFTKNEPSQMAVQEAIEKSVEILIIEGIKDNLWSTKEGKEQNKEIVDQYLLEKELEESTGLYERRYLENYFKSQLNINFGMALVDGDYSTGILDYKFGLMYKYSILPELRLAADFQFFRLNSTPQINHWWLSESLNVEYNMLPYDKLSPIFYAGPGILHFADDTPVGDLQRWNSFFNLKLGAGLEYHVSPKISFVLNGEWDITFTDKIDNLPQGRRDDFYYTMSIGLSYHFGSSKTKNMKLQ